MAEADPPARTISLGTGIAAIDAAAWDALHDGGNPFAGHAFLTLLEESGSVGAGTGWQAAPLLVEDATGALVAAAPAYLKSHSQGEYVFDHAWADAWSRAGGDYYPKLQIAVPFTPVPSEIVRAGGSASAIYAGRTATIASASTAAPSGSTATPTAARAWRPASPNSVSNSSDAPLATFA